MFSNCFAWTADILKKNVPDGKLGIYPTVGGQPYTGAWSVGVSKASKNPEAAYWLVRYLASFQCHEAVMKQGGQVTCWGKLGVINYFLPQRVLQKFSQVLTTRTEMQSGSVHSHYGLGENITYLLERELKTPGFLRQIRRSP